MLEWQHRRKGREGKRKWGGGVGRKAGVRKRGVERMGRTGSGAGWLEVGREGGETTGPLARDVTVYSTGCRRRGGRTDTNPFQDIYYMERMERNFGVGNKRDGKIQCGCWGILGNKTDGRHLHRGCCDTGANPAPRWRPTLLPVITRLHSRGDMPAQRKIHCVLSGDGGEVLVHFRMLPGDGRQSNDLGRGGGNGGAANRD